MAKEVKTEEVNISEPKLVDVGDDIYIAVDAEMFKDMFSLMSALILDEVQVQIRNDGLYVQQMEGARIGMTIMFIPKTYFKALKPGKFTPELRLPVTEIKGILSRLVHGDVLQITVTKIGKLHIEIQGKRIRVFELPLFEEEKLERRIPLIPLNVRTKATMEGLIVAIEDAKKIMAKHGSKTRNVYGTVTFLTEPMGLKVTAMSDDEMASSSTTLNSGWDLMKFEGSIGQTVSISIAYLTDVVSAISKITNMVQLEYSTNMPLHLIAEMPLKGVILEFWFAPRILEQTPSKKEVKESA